MKAELPMGFICHCADCKGRGLHTRVAALENVIDAMEKRHAIELRAAVAAEREACAKICDDLGSGKDGGYPDNERCAESCADAIRERGGGTK